MVQKHNPHADMPLPEVSVRKTMPVGKLKYVFILMALLITAALVIWPMTDYGKKSAPIGFVETTEFDDMQTRMINPRFHGKDQKMQPFNVTASDAMQLTEQEVELSTINADISLNDGGWLSLLAKRGVYTLDKKMLDLSGDVNVFSDDGYEVFTEKAVAYINNGIVVGTHPVSVRGAPGDVEADSFEVIEHGDELIFKGGVHVQALPAK